MPVMMKRRRQEDGETSCSPNPKDRRIEESNYEPQTQLINSSTGTGSSQVHCERICTYDRSMDKMGPSSSSILSSSSSLPMAHFQSWKMHEQDTTKSAQTMAILPSSKSLDTVTTATTMTNHGSAHATINPSSERWILSSSPVNPYVKSTDKRPGKNIRTTSSPHNPYKKTSTGRTEINKSQSFTVNPYIKRNNSVTATFKPTCSRDIFSSQPPLRQQQEQQQETSGSHTFSTRPPLHPQNGIRAPTTTSLHGEPSILLPSKSPPPTLVQNTSATQQLTISPCAKLESTAPNASRTTKGTSTLLVDVPQNDVTLFPTVPPTTGSHYPSLLPPRPETWTGVNSKSLHASARPPQSQDNPPLTGSRTKRPELPGEAPLPPELTYDPETIQPIKDEYRSKLTINARLEQPLLNGWTLYGHQKRAILKGLMKRRLILALDMGLGKTLIGCVWARAFQESYDGLKIFVVCPVTLKKEWKRTAEEATGLVVEEEKKPRGTTDDSLLDVTIATWAKVPTTVDPRVQHFVVVFDEAHAMQSMESNRTQAALKLVFDKRCVGVLLLTGTPMKNGKPCNLFPLLKAVQHPLGRHQNAYERHFCQGRMVSMGGRAPQWIASGQANLKQLHRMIESNLLHMTKDEYLKELPPMKHETRTVPVSARFHKQYQEKVKNMASLKEAMKTNRDLNHNALMGATQDLRVVCAFAKIGATVEIAKEILQIEPSVVIFTNFAKAASSIHRQLEDCGWKSALLTGDTPAKKRQELVDGFQQELYSAFIATFGAGGVGITLTQARTIIFLDRPWTPGELLQAEDRIRRIGQDKETRSIWVSAFEFDSQLDAMLQEKNKAANAVLTKTGISTGDTSASIDIGKLVTALIASDSHSRMGG